MTDVLIRDLDDDILDHLKRRAERNDRSLQSELKRIVEQNARIDTGDFWDKVDQIREQSESRDKEFSDSSELLREDRER
jgi:hypothetical protein